MTTKEINERIKLRLDGLLQEDFKEWMMFLNYIEASALPKGIYLGKNKIDDDAIRTAFEWYKEERL